MWGTGGRLNAREREEERRRKQTTSGRFDRTHHFGDRGDPEATVAAAAQVVSSGVVVGGTAQALVHTGWSSARTLHIRTRQIPSYTTLAARAGAVYVTASRSRLAERAARERRPRCSVHRPARPRAPRALRRSPPGPTPPPRAAPHRIASYVR